MADEVWNNFIFKPVQTEDYPRVLAHMREAFYRDEPLNAITGYSVSKPILQILKYEQNQYVSPHLSLSIFLSVQGGVLYDIIIPTNYTFGFYIYYD